ncbi:ABC transporter transmembrane domain-containing protein [Aeromonas hydrophila]|uniref:ABC transporter transmembrane domain-containing protein n=1 Tax=Aeromonas hydrophila TaxID=644 RepID=UPI0003A3DFEE|nr:ABC transporter transmembrane domain-containing protein [Aeromonas hydrophila]AHX32628.1 multidrug ABC transporter ATP-binding protein [Aeromonas hydrophila subsp. hydrophila AL09-71]AHX69426.1 multidrug ABC transporter ATP-binding protein [Aeromonas hydrophila pc104A]AJE36563.1 multidrug ABC transporter ATP-binding protein [Aeromonas hydrophila J-1]AKJ34824.1 multidrug ABC transporter ATP-binding protein [Aeromonas hydrophila NJ-35]ALQ63666.1 multidrug ABC transporter ATP-binding protein [
MSVFARLGWFFKEQWRRYLIAISLLMMVALLTVIPPKVVGWVVDGIAKGSLDSATLTGYLAGLFGLGLLIYLLRYVWRVMLFGASYRLAYVLRNRLFSHFTRMSPDFYQRHRTGDLMAHATNDIQAVEMTAGEGVLTLVDSMIVGVLVLSIMCSQYSWQLTLLSLLPLPVMAFFMNRFGTQIYKEFKAAQGAFSRLNNKTQEALSGVRVLKSYAVESLEDRGFAELTREAGACNMAVARIDAKFDPVIYLCIGCSYFLAVAGGSALVLRDELTLGELTSFTMYLGQLIWPMFAIAWLFNIIERGSAAYSRIESLLAERSDIEEPAQPVALTSASAFPLRAVALSYQLEQRTLLRNVDFTLQAGGMLGIVGRTGAGKSSLLKLLMRLANPTAGEIRMGEVPISQLALGELRGQFAYVPQEPFLFSTTIAANIALGRPDASREEIERVARIACVHDDISRFPKGYETEVGEKGVTLSGGQKQRLAIARALLLEAPILVLDDALSAVDAHTEQQILHALKAHKRTLILVSHRMTAVEQADEILVLEEGHVSERGRHGALMAHNGWYADMVRYQRLEQDVEESL